MGLFIKNDVIFEQNQVYANDAGSLKDYTKQDSIILNIQRACEASIDLAMHIVGYAYCS